MERNALSSSLIFPFIGHIHVGSCHLNQWAFKQIILQSVFMACSYPNAPMRSTSFRCHNHTSEGKPRFQTWICLLNASLLSTAAGVHSIIDCLWATLLLVDLNVFILLSIKKRRLLLPDAKYNFDGFHWIIIWLCLFALQLIWILFTFPSRIRRIALDRSTVQGVLRNVDVIFV